MHFDQLIHLKCTFNELYSKVDEEPMHFFIGGCALLQNSGFKPDAQIIVDKPNMKTFTSRAL